MKWHNPGLGEVHNEDHSQMIYCEDADGVVDDDLAERVCNLLNMKTTVAWLHVHPEYEPKGDICKYRLNGVDKLLGWLEYPLGVIPQ